MSALFDRSSMARFSHDLGEVSWLYILQGCALVLLGTLIVIFPELLAVLVAVFLIAVGALAIATGWRLRRVRRSFEDLGRSLWE